MITSKKNNSILNFKKLIQIIIVILLVLLSTNLISAHIESVNPDNTHLTNQLNISFEFYISMNDVTQCTLNINDQQNSQQIPKTNIQDGFNGFLLTNLNPGTYDWLVTCQNGSLTESTEERRVIIDVTEPEVLIISPTEPGPSLNLEFQVTDNISDIMECKINVSNQETVSNQEQIINASNNDLVKVNFSLLPGTYLTTISCYDEAGNKGMASRDITINKQDYFRISTNKKVYGLAESAYLTFDALEDAAISIEICPNQTGFVQCISPIINQGDYPQTVTLPFTNKTGSYIIEAYAQTPRGTLVNNTGYVTQNTMSLSLRTDEDPRLGSEFNLIADADGGVGDLSYEWRLTNGTETSTENTKLIKYANPGIYVEKVIVKDEAGNSLEANISINIEPLYLVSIFVWDENSKEAIKQAKVMIAGDNDNYYTDNDGLVKLNLGSGTNKIYAEKAGYDYKYKDIYINENITVANITLKPEATTFGLEILSVTDPLIISFKLNGGINAVCDLLTNKTGKFEKSASINVNNENNQLISTDLSYGTFQYSLTCKQDGFITSTPVKTIDLIKSEEVIESDAESSIINYDQYKDYFEEVIDFMPTLGKEEQEVISLLNIKDDLRQSKKRAGQLGRDLYDLQKNSELESDVKLQKRNEMVSELDSLVDDSIVSIRVRDTKIINNYVTEEDLKLYSEKYNDYFKENFGKDITPLLKIIFEAQQKYTLETKFYHTVLTYGDESTKEITVVEKKFVYGSEKKSEGAENEKLIEIIPENIGDDIIIVSEDVQRIASNILDSPARGELVYYVEKEVAFSELTNAKTILLPDLLSIESNSLTGFSIFGSGLLNGVAGKLGISLIALILLIVIAYLIYYFNLIDHIKFFIFEAGKKEKVHYTRVLINDARDNLSAGNYDKALLIYKEICLSYDQLKIPEKNVVQEEIVELCSDIDKYFMNSLIIDMDGALKDNRLEDAINYFEKVEGTYERLPEQEQEKLIFVVQSLAKRLGVTQ